MLHETGSGLLNSHITWNDLQDALLKKYGENAKIGEKRSITPIGGGIGLQSLLGLVNPDWIIENGVLPSQFVLKIASPIIMIETMKEEKNIIADEEITTKMNICMENFVEFLRPCHNAEVLFYQTAAGLKQKLPELPVLYCSELFTERNPVKAFQVMDFLEGVSLPPTANLSRDQIEQILRAMARMAVSFSAVSKDEQKMFTHQGLAGIYSKMCDWMIGFYNSLMAGFPDPRLQPLIQKFEQILPNIISANEIDHLNEKLNMKKIIVHGDLWSSNVMWKKNDITQLDKIIDFQMCHFGMLATDITRLLNTSTSPEDRRLNWKNYLKVYYDEMIRVLNGSSAPFSLEQLELTYRIVYPRVASFLIPALFALFHSTMKIFKENEGNGVSKLLLEKIVSIYEDIIDHHENKPSHL